MRTVTDRFSLVDKIRKHTTQNGRRYMLESVNSTFNDPATKERIALGEMFGYFGHGRRAMNFEKTGSLTLPETTIIMVDGKPVIIDNVPSNRTLDISMDDSGIVSHTQEILDTPTGQIVDGMEKAKAGGWSWATGGDDQIMRSFVSSYHGMDYVNNPNYISIDKKGMMFESVEARQESIIRGLQNSGFSEEAAIDISSHFEKLNAIEPATLLERNAMLESALAMQEIKSQRLSADQRQAANEIAAAKKAGERRKEIMMEAIGNMPLFLSKSQKEALVRMETDDDIRIVAAMLEAAATKATSSLPITARQPESTFAKPSKFAVEDDTAYFFQLS